MTVRNVESLLVTVDLFGPLASEAYALPENSCRLLPENAGESFTPNPNATSNVPMNELFTNSREIQTLKPGNIALYLNQPPKDIAKGFVFGSDPRLCDVLLATTKSSGISANHFSIHIDWVSRDAMITCLSKNDLTVKVIGTKAPRILSMKMWQTAKPGMPMTVHITGNLVALISSPTRGKLQAAYDQNLHNYFEEYVDAVPELAHVSLRDPEVTPLILDRCAGLDGKEYYSTERIETGDVDYDAKVFLYNAKAKLTPKDLLRIRGITGGYEDVEDWLLSDPKGNRAGELYVVKNFRDKKTDLALPHRQKELCRLNHPNLEEFVDMIIETSVFMVVTSVFSFTTLHTLLQEEDPLNRNEVGFVAGQMFAALEYLHDHQWTHGNLDPRSIQVMSRKRLWIQLTDATLSWFVDLGKPDGYNSVYASQFFGNIDKSPADIWSAGVVSLQLLLPNGLPHGLPISLSQRAKRLACLAEDMDSKSGNDAKAFVTSVLKYNVEERPKATEVLKHPFIVQNGWETPLNNPHYTFPTPHGSRHTSLGPSNAPSRQNSPAPLGMNSLVPEIGTTRQYHSHDKTNMTGEPGSSRSQSRSGGSKSTVGDGATGTVGRIESQREVDIEEDSGEETETGKRREPITKKPRRGVDGPTHQKNLRSWSKKPR